MIFIRKKEAKVTCTKNNDGIVLDCSTLKPFEVHVYMRDKSGKIHTNGYKIRVNKSGTIQMVKDLAG